MALRSRFLRKTSITNCLSEPKKKVYYVATVLPIFYLGLITGTSINFVFTIPVSFCKSLQSPRGSVLELHGRGPPDLSGAKVLFTPPIELLADPKSSAEPDQLSLKSFQGSSRSRDQQGARIASRLGSFPGPRSYLKLIAKRCVRGANERK
jgi:hypothetical protein